MSYILYMHLSYGGLGKLDRDVRWSFFSGIVPVVFLPVTALGVAAWVAKRQNASRRGRVNGWGVGKLVTQIGHRDFSGRRL